MLGRDYLNKWNCELNSLILKLIDAETENIKTKNTVPSAYEDNGVDTFVQGTVVQGPLCPRDISPRRLLSKETLVQGDYCPR